MAKLLPIPLKSGELHFVVELDGSPQTWVADLVTLKLICEAEETRFDLDVDQDNRLVATSEFLASLSRKFVEEGCPACDPTQAKSVWIVVAQEFGKFNAEFRKSIEKL